ncbi:MULTISPECIES: DUF4012 domain-containing protein [unclassified Aeromicrobium]|uniref:DUF4012 domain-containing protein n=1 Tax=unclassified Aeromicrobium TaxID=2633570 RepID=UPI00288A7DE8|nr:MULTISPECIES: DUF4012 domain-containing protein [unclassified Aeromicrobium]
MPSSSRTSRSRRRRSTPGRSRKPLWIGLGVVAVVLVGALGWLGYEASQAQKAIASATDEAKDLQSQITSGDTDLARNTLRALQESTTTARTRTDGPLWGAVAKVPFVGSSISAVQTAAGSLDDIAQRGLPPVVETSTSLDSNLFRPDDGQFPLEEFAGLAKPVSTAANVLTENRERIDAIDGGSLIGPVKGPVDELKEKVGTAQRAAAAAAKGLRLAPPMLGIEGKRTYLLMFQNNAESRSLGGIPGALALVTAENGELEFDQQFTIGDLEDFDDPVVKVTDNEQRTYGTTIAEDIRDTTLTPDFPRVAKIARAMVEESFDVKVEGVLSIDPVALSYVLDGTGPIEVGDDTTLTTDNAVEILLNTVYARYEDPQVQDAFFADAAQKIFKAALSGRGDSRKTLEGLTKAVDERRIMLWSAQKDEEADLAGTRLAGGLPAESSTPHVGVYVNDTTSSKMQYYLDWSTTVESTRCTDGGAQTLVATTTVESTAPADASGLPDYITGNGSRAPEGDQQFTVRVFAPWGGTIESVDADDAQSLDTSGRSGERPVALTAFTLEPGQKVQIRTTMTSGEGQRAGAVVTTTPGVRSLDQDRRFGSSCA